MVTFDATPSCAAAILKGDSAAEILEQALAYSHLKLHTWRMTRCFDRPGAETSAIYEAHTDQGIVHLVASTAQLSPAEQDNARAVRLESEAGTIYLWAHPQDPRLPGLKLACSGLSLAQRISNVFGGKPPEVTSLKILVLKPLRRAVLRVTTTLKSHPELFIKVVRPGRQDDLLDRHRLLDLAPAAYDAGDGLVVVEPAEGRPLTEHLYHRGCPPRPEVLLTALNTLHTTPGWQDQQFVPRPAPADRLSR